MSRPSYRALLEQKNKSNTVRANTASKVAENLKRLNLSVRPKSDSSVKTNKVDNYIQLALPSDNISLEDWLPKNFIFDQEQYVVNKDTQIISSQKSIDVGCDSSKYERVTSIPSFTLQPYSSNVYKERLQNLKKFFQSQQYKQSQPIRQPLDLPDKIGKRISLIDWEEYLSIYEYNQSVYLEDYEEIRKGEKLQNLEQWFYNIDEPKPLIKNVANKREWEEKYNFKITHGYSWYADNNAKKYLRRCQRIV